MNDKLYLIGGAGKISDRVRFFMNKYSNNQKAMAKNSTLGLIISIQVDTTTKSCAIANVFKTLFHVTIISFLFSFCFCVLKAIS